MQQKPDQSVADYLKSFKAEKDVLVAQAGDMMFAQFVTNQKQDEIDEIKASGKTADEKKAETKAILEAGVKEVHAMLFFMGADVTKYGSLLRKLRSDYGRRLPNVYPKDLQDAVNTLNTHTWDQACHDAKKQKRQQAKEQKQKEPASESNQTSFAQKGKDIICFICGDPTHKSPDCNQKDKPKSEWWIAEEFCPTGHQQ